MKMIYDLDIQNLQRISTQYNRYKVNYKVSREKENQSVIL